MKECEFPSCDCPTSGFEKLCKHVASSAKNELVMKPCPCGEEPEDAVITDAGQGAKWARVSGSCCGMWEIEFRTDYNLLDSDECKRLAIGAWNDAPRAS